MRLTKNEECSSVDEELPLKNSVFFKDAVVSGNAVIEIYSHFPRAKFYNRKNIMVRSVRAIPTVYTY